MGVLCRKCGATVAPAEKFCGECGTPLASAPLPPQPGAAGPRCPHCGAPNPAGDAFCGECGASTGPATPPPPVPAPSRSKAPLIAGVLGFLLVALGALLWLGYRQFGDRIDQMLGRQPAPVETAQSPAPTETTPPQTPPPQQEQPQQPTPPPEQQAPPPSESSRTPPATITRPPQRETAPVTRPPERIETPPTSQQQPPPSQPEQTSPPLVQRREPPPTPAPARTEAPRIETQEPATPTPPLRREEPPAPPRQPAYSGPRSGVINWSGQIDKDGTFTIDGSRASAGTVNGALPGVPVIVQVDAKEYAIVEAPSPSNGWKRLTIRSRKKRHAVVPIQWSVLQ